MPQTPPKQTSIAEEGLMIYLDRTARFHNGYGYQDFVKNVDKLSRVSLGKMFGVTKHTIYKWLRIHEKECQL